MSINKSRYNDYMQQRGGYAVVPNEIWETDLDPATKVIWCYLLSRTPTWDSSRNNLAANLGYHRNTVSSCVAELESRNMLRITSPGRQRWDFEILPPSEWKDVLALSGNRAKSEPVPSVCIQDIHSVHTGTPTEPHPRRKEESRLARENFGLNGLDASFSCEDEILSPEVNSSYPEKSGSSSYKNIFSPPVNFQEDGASHRAHAGQAKTSNGINPRHQAHAIPFQTQGNAQSTSTSHPNSVSIDEVILAWAANLPKPLGKQRNDYLYSLFEDLKLRAGAKASDIDASLKRQILSKLVPQTKPKSTSQENYETWKRCAAEDLDRQFAIVFLQAPVFKPTPSVELKESEPEDIEMVSWNMINKIAASKKKQ